MNSENTKKILEKYPELTANSKLSMSESCMYWLFEFGDGWYDLMDKLCEDIMKLDVDKICRFDQTKEKFAQLRIYWHLIDEDKHNIYDKIYELIDKAEDESANICESCGNPGKITGGYWLKTLCENCLKKEN